MELDLLFRRAGDAENRFGPMAMFLQAGFHAHKEGDHGSVCVRKLLA